MMIHRNKAYLWAIGGDGSVRIAELQKKDGKDLVGHPQLLDGGPARLAGELHFDDRARAWTLDNNSGRYGFYPGTTARNLEAAKTIVAGVGENGDGSALNIRTRFIPSPVDNPNDHSKDTRRLKKWIDHGGYSLRPSRGQKKESLPVGLQTKKERKAWAGAAAKTLGLGP
jgi:hypothetical protein